MEPGDAAERVKIEALVDIVHHSLLAMHAIFHREGDPEDVDWLETAFRDSLAVIQERAQVDDGEEECVHNTQPRSGSATRVAI